MRRLGSLLLASVLLGVPRALDRRRLAARRPVRLHVAPDTALAGFAEALFAALASAPWRLVPRWRAAATSIDVKGLAAGRDARGRRFDAITLHVREGGRLRHLLLHAPEARHADAARELVSRLRPGDC